LAAKTKNDEATAEPEALATVKADLGAMFDVGTLADLQQRYGITPADVTVPVPATPTALNFIELCSLTTPITDEFGNQYEDVMGHTGPLMFLEKRGESDGDKYDAYDGFYIYAIMAPAKGEVIVTVGRLKGDKKGSVPVYLDGLTKGQLFQVARFKTSHGYGVLNPIPVQIDGKLIR
jgi:hypothetical protein